MPTITRRLEFDAGHRILNHESRCKNPHGHRYSAEITVQAEDLDILGRVIDFGVVKELIGTWIDENWDHTIILSEDDPLIRCEEIFSAEKPPYIISAMEIEGPTCPTAEVLAKILYGKCRTLLPDDVKVKRVRLYETPNCWADYPDK